jgi:hypothetical protein
VYSEHKLCQHPVLLETKPFEGFLKPAVSKLHMGGFFTAAHRPLRLTAFSMTCDFHDAPDPMAGMYVSRRQIVAHGRHKACLVFMTASQNHCSGRPFGTHGVYQTAQHVHNLPRVVKGHG